jgi:hypothetical protein
MWILIRQQIKKIIEIPLAKISTYFLTTSNLYRYFFLDFHDKFKAPREASRENIQPLKQEVPVPIPGTHLFSFSNRYGFSRSRSTNLIEPDQIKKLDLGSQHCLITNLKDKNILLKIKEM